MNTTSDFSAKCLNMQRHKFEEQIVDVLLDRYGLSKKWRWRLLSEYKEREQKYRLTLAYFEERFPSFPVHLEVAKSKKVKDHHPFSKMITGFASLPLVHEFFDLREAYRETCDAAKPFGLVVKWPYVDSAKGLVLHEYPIDVAAAGNRFIHCCEDGETQLVLESVPALCDGLDWEI